MKYYIYFFIFCCICLFHDAKCGSTPINFNDESIFNKITKFDSKYLMNNFAQNKNGDLVLELTDLIKDDNNEFSSRLFYGMTKEGRPLFSNKTSYTKEIQINKSKEILNGDECTDINRSHNSINLFVSIKNAPNKNCQYLFSINPHNSMLELFNLNDDKADYYLWGFNTFFNLSSND